MIRTLLATSLGCFFAVAAIGQAFDQPFQSHTPDGIAYWVVTCFQADQCLEDAYKWCNGPYTPMDKQFAPAGGFRFFCRKPHKDEKSSAPPPAS